jgi:hypothetical protein
MAMMRWLLSGVRGHSGQIAIVYAGAMVALIGAVGLGADVSVMYYNRLSMQNAVDAAALAAANDLPEDRALASSDAIGHGEANGLAASEMARPVIASDLRFIRVSAARLVPYFFARPFGFKQQLIQVAATASASGSGACGACRVDDRSDLATANSMSAFSSIAVALQQPGISAVALEIGPAPEWPVEWKNISKDDDFFAVGH